MWVTCKHGLVEDHTDAVDSDGSGGGGRVGYLERMRRTLGGSDGRRIWLLMVGVVGSFFVSMASCRVQPASTAEAGYIWEGA